MRNTLVGAVLAAVLVAALFAASYYRHRPAEGAAPGVPPDQAAAQLENDWTGETRIGAWKLVCNEGKALPRPPSNGMTGNSAGTPPREAPPPPGWKLPRCFVGLVIHNPNDPKDEIRVTFRTIGFKRVLALFLRFPPSDVTTGDTVKARFDATEWELPVRSCPAQFCLAIRSVKHDDAPLVEKAKTFEIAFKPGDRPNEIVLPLPTEGLGAAVKAMRRLNH